MKMKLNINTRNWVLAAIALFSMASCTQQTIPGNDDSGPGKGKLLTVYFSVNKKNYAGAHGLNAEDKQDGGTTTTTDNPIIFGSGYILFVSGDPAIKDLRTLADNSYVKKVVKIVPDNTQDPGPDEIKVSDLTKDDGKEITKVPSESSQVIILGNTDSKFDELTINVGQSLKTVLKHGMDVTKQTTASSANATTASTIANASLVGMQTISWTTVGDVTTGKANITIVPLVSRIEIKKVTNIKNDEDMLLNSYSLRGIYIDNTPKTAYLGGIYFEGNGSSIPDADILNAKSTDDFDPTSGMYEKNHYNKVLADYVDWKTSPDEYIGKQNAKAGTEGMNYTPKTSGQVWAYNIYAGYEYYKRQDDGSRKPADGVTPTPLLPMPYIILDIGKTMPAVPGKDNQYIFYKQFTTGGGTTPTTLTAAEPGTIYLFEYLPFKNTDVHPDPQPVENPVTVKVTQMSWSTVPVDPPTPN